MNVPTPSVVGACLLIYCCKISMVVSLCALIGCGQQSDDPRVFHARGQITFEGKPVPRGGISFEPDGEFGNSGPQGFAEIIDGNYDTASSGRATTGGAQIVTITGYDGQATEDNPEGTSLFSGWSTTTTFTDDKQADIDFHVEKVNHASSSTGKR